MAESLKRGPINTEHFERNDLIDWADVPMVNGLKESVGSGPFTILRIEPYRVDEIDRRNPAFHPQTLFFSKRVGAEELVYAPANKNWHPIREGVDGYFIGPSGFSGYYFRKAIQSETTP